MLADAPVLAASRAATIGRGWISGRVVVRRTTIPVEDVRRVVLYTDEAAVQSVVVEAGPFRSVAVPLRAVRDDRSLRDALALLVADAQAVGAQVHDAVTSALID